MKRSRTIGITAAALAASALLTVPLRAEQTNSPVVAPARTNYTIPQLVIEMERTGQTNNSAYRFALECLENSKQVLALQAESDRAVSNMAWRLDDFGRQRAAIEREEAERSRALEEIMGHVRGATTQGLTNFAARLARRFGPMDPGPEQAKSPKDVAEGLARATANYGAMLDIIRKLENLQISPSTASAAVSNLNAHQNLEDADGASRARAARAIDAYLGKATLVQLTNLAAALRKDEAQPKTPK